MPFQSAVGQGVVHDAANTISRPPQPPSSTTISSPTITPPALLSAPSLHSNHNPRHQYKTRGRQISISAKVVAAADAGANRRSKISFLRGQHGVESNGVRGDNHSPEASDHSRHGSPNDSATYHVKDARRQQSTAADDSDKRLLRSQVGTSRVRSELELFFPDYRDLVFGPEQEKKLLTGDSVFYFTDDKTIATSTDLPFRSKIDILAAPGEPQFKRRKSNHTDGTSFLSTPESPSVYQTVDLSAFAGEAQEFEGDPLPDSVYLQAHARGERRQKKERNVEKERSAHEKAQLQGLYDGLRGPDWLKTMGVSGVTDTEKKRFESKRDKCIVRVKRMLSKFDDYKEQEKILKTRRDRLAARAAVQGEDDEEDADEEDVEDDEEADADEVSSGIEDDGIVDEDEDDDAFPNGREPLHSHLDESALQLQQEASLASEPPVKIKLRVATTAVARESRGGGRLTKVREHSTKAPPPPPPPPPPFTTFFAKPHERAGAMAKHRRGRHAIAFGQPIPDMPDMRDFRLPEEFYVAVDFR